MRAWHGGAQACRHALTRGCGLGLTCHSARMRGQSCWTRRLRVHRRTGSKPSFTSGNTSTSSPRTRSRASRMCTCAVAVATYAHMHPHARAHAHAHPRTHARVRAPTHTHTAPTRRMIRLRRAWGCRCRARTRGCTRLMCRWSRPNSQAMESEIESETKLRRRGNEAGSKLSCDCCARRKWGESNSSQLRHWRKERTTRKWLKYPLGALGELLSICDTDTKIAMATNDCCPRRQKRPFWSHVVVATVVTVLSCQNAAIVF